MHDHDFSLIVSKNIIYNANKLVKKKLRYYNLLFSTYPLPVWFLYLLYMIYSNIPHVIDVIDDDSMKNICQILN